MKKRITILMAIVLCFAMMFSFASCSGTEGEDEATDVFTGAVIDVGDDIPVSEKEIIKFYNNLITKIQLADTFTEKDKPGVLTSESLHVDNINILSYDAATGEAKEDGKLDAFNKSSGVVKSRILSGIDTSIPVLAFGDMNAAIDSVIYPYDNAEVKLTSDDVIKAESHADGNNLNISITLANNADTVANVFGTRDKAAVLATFNEKCKDYASINDYTVNYVADEENNTYSTINLSVELVKQDDGTFKCTGRITSFRIVVIADISATATTVGSFADYGDIQVNFRLTDEKNYEFDWLGNATWEPYVGEDATE
ncbi:MAG: hypothetical protein IJ289_02865 [Clostridia bacterium]|nr:hypothetical protein [Clostridia bacterium]